MDEIKEVSKEGSQLKREVDSVDDFEHLGSPMKDKIDTGDLLGLDQPVSQGIDKKRAVTSSAITDVFDPLVTQKMDSHLILMGDSIPTGGNAGDFSSMPKNFSDKSSIQAFLDGEREHKTEQPAPFQAFRSNNDMLNRYSDSEPEQDDVKTSKLESFPKKVELPGFGSTDNFRADAFKDIDDSHVEPPKKTQIEEKIPEPVFKPKTPEPVKEKTPEPVPEPVPKIMESVKKEPVVVPPTKAVEKVPQKPKIGLADAEVIFCKMGLNTWFNPERLNPKVESLIYWRDPKRSGPVFGGVLVVLLALTYFSLISVVAYLSLIALTGTIAFRIYKNVVQAVQKTGDGHPFKELLGADVALPQDKVKEVIEVAVAHINAAIVELRRLFLVEDLVDSIKFGVLLWTLTYLGAWFNGMTLIIIAWVALFTLPKVYETNKTQIDANLEIVRTKLAEITSKVKAAIPIGKKAEEKKEQ